MSFRSPRARIAFPALVIPIAFLVVLPTVFPIEEIPTATAAAPVLPSDPLPLLLQRAGPSAEREERILEELRRVMGDARDERASADARRAAVREIDALIEELAVIEDWRPLVVAELLAPLGDTAAVNRALDTIDPATGLTAGWGWRIRVEAYEAARDSVGARRAAEMEAARARTVGEAAAPWNRAGRLALALGDTAGAHDAFARVLDAGPRHASAGSAARSLEEIRRTGGIDPLLFGEALLAGGAPDAALRYLTPTFGNGDAPTREIAELRVALGRAFVDVRRPGDAIDVLRPISGDDTPAEFAAPALYWIGVAELQRNRNAEGEAAFLRLARRDPGSSLAEEALLLLVERAAQGGRPPNDNLFREFLRVGVGSAAGDLIAVQHGSRSYLSGSFRDAADTFDRYLEGARRPASRAQAAYWSALAHERLGDRDRYEARLRVAWEEDPISFYGVLAGERIDAPVLDPALAQGPTPVPGLGREIRSALTRLRLHQIVPTAGSFAFELDRLQEHFFRRGDGAYDLAEALFAGGFPIQGVVLGREIHRREDGVWNLRLLRIVFPFPHREIVVREARSLGLDPFFVAGIIRQESMFHASIVSSAGAVGLMQLLPGTAQEVARSLGIRYERARLDEPEYNVRLGTRYLANMLGRFDGRVEDALSAYNAGPGRINQWRQRPEYRDRDVFTEHIPFRETRNYVKVVQQNKRVYTALYGCAGFEACLGDSYRTVLARSPYAGGRPASVLAR